MSCKLSKGEKAELQESGMQLEQTNHPFHSSWLLMNVLKSGGGWERGWGGGVYINSVSERAKKII